MNAYTVQRFHDHRAPLNVASTGTGTTIKALSKNSTRDPVTSWRDNPTSHRNCTTRATLVEAGPALGQNRIQARNNK